MAARSADEIITGAHQHVVALDKIRMWLLDNRAADLRRRIAKGLVISGGAAPDAAQAVARTIANHLSVAEEQVTEAAKQLEALQVDLQSLYIDPINEWTAEQRSGSSDAMKVD